MSAESHTTRSRRNVFMENRLNRIRSCVEANLAKSVCKLVFSLRELPATSIQVSVGCHGFEIMSGSVFYNVPLSSKTERRWLGCERNKERNEKERTRGRKKERKEKETMEERKKEIRKNYGKNNDRKWKESKL